MNTSQRQEIYDMIMEKTFNAYNAEKELTSKVYMLTSTEHEPDVLSINEMVVENKKLDNPLNAMATILHVITVKARIESEIERLKAEGNSLLGMLHVDVYESGKTTIKTSFFAYDYEMHETYDVELNSEETPYVNENGAIINRVFNFNK